MAPIKNNGSQEHKNIVTKPLIPLARRVIPTRSQQLQENVNPGALRSKRKADNSPLKNEKIKRSALGNLTNNAAKLDDESKKTKTASTSGQTFLKNIDVNKTNYNAVVDKNQNKNSGILQQNNTNGILLRGNKVVTRAASMKNSLPTNNAVYNPIVPADIKIEVIPKAYQESAATVMKAKEAREVATKRNSRRLSNEFDKIEDNTLYMSALEDLPLSGESARHSAQFDMKRKSIPLYKFDNSKPEQLDTIDEFSGGRILTPSPLKSQPTPVPNGVDDFDQTNWNDPFQVSPYAMHIFDYLKNREAEFPIEDYMEKQEHLSKWMRALLVDWMVEVQETFELNHETLYLAVKLVDIYLCREIVQKEKLQLLGAAALFIACKFDERTPPLVGDFAYICDGAFQNNEIIKMEMKVLKTIGFDLGIPLSYRFLRRYARCAYVPMHTLTLARYILEFSLMDYATISLSDSKMACAALFIALKMKNPKSEDPIWNDTLEFFTGYKLDDFAYIIEILNAGLIRKPRDAIKTIRKKYSHTIFFQVAKIPLLTSTHLLQNTGIMKKENE